MEDMNKIISALSGIKVVPVIAINDVNKAVPLAQALAAGGLPCAEITFRTTEGEEAIRRIASEAPDVLVGAGTVLAVEQVDRAKAAGARFAVSPGFNPRVVDHCIDIGLPVFPGCSTPSDMEQAIERGLNVVKFFPAEATGGLAYLKAIASPYSMLRFIPTGGISPGNLAQYLAFPRVLACGGSWMVKADLIDAGRFDDITKLCEEAVKIAKQAKAGVIK
jgi:2-dehydro-3-deoxyphosphogluconate aldolase/(4S)-4-hydroxy-2-oxoglutarate aldolase